MKKRAAARPSLTEIRRNDRNVVGGATLLASLKDRSAALAFLDPQYRGVLDKMKYGNEGARQQARAKLPQMTQDDIRHFVEEIERALKPSGHLLLWADKFAIASAEHLRWTRGARALRLVDLLSWNKTTFGMGRRFRCCTEYMIVLQKVPTRAKGVWKDRAITDSWIEGADRERHPHAKPTALIARMIRSVTRRGDLVVDPCAGGYGVLEACRATGRQFVGGDLL